MQVLRLGRLEKLCRVDTGKGEGGAAENRGDRLQHVAG